MPYDLVLFDLDGTLSDPMEGIGHSLNHALSHFGYEPLAFADLATYVGTPLDETFKAITGGSAESEVNALVTKFRERYADVGYSENKLYPGVVEALEALRAANTPMAVCTSKRRDFAEKILTMFGLIQYFRFIDGGEIGTHKWQQMAVLLAQGKVSKSSIMVGDRSVDMIAAHRNGLQAAGVLWGYGSHAELSSEMPVRLFSSPGELAELANGRGQSALKLCDRT